MTPRLVSAAARASGLLALALTTASRTPATSYTYGGRIGGPIVLPGFDGRGKAFFFFNQ